MFLKIIGVLSSFMLIIGGMTSIEGCCINENFYNGVGFGLIGLGCFTGPFLWGMSNALDRLNKIKN